MRINANNFTGKLINGNRYRINTKRTFNKDYQEYCIEFTVSEYVHDAWFIQSGFTFSVWYENESEYKKALKEGLLTLEGKLSINLLKREKNADVTRIDNINKLWNQIVYKEEFKNNILTAFQINLEELLMKKGINISETKQDAIIRLMQRCIQQQNRVLSN